MLRKILQTEICQMIRTLNFDFVSVIPTFNSDERKSVADFISKVEDVGT